MSESLTELRRSVRGAVIAPADPGYDVVRRCFNGLIDRRPAAIVRCLDAGDVATALDFARSQALEVAVRGGGHNPSGHCVCDDGLVIDLSLMRTVEVNGEARIASSQGGATWLDFDSATQAFGLVTPGGVVGSTGVAGLTFGRDGGGDRALVGERRLRQLHAGRRADRARAGRLRRADLRALAGAEDRVRPGQRPASQPEHPAVRLSQ